MCKFLTLALTPALVIFGVLLGTFAYVDHAVGVSGPYPWGFIWLATGFALSMGVAGAIAEWHEQRPCH